VVSVTGSPVVNLGFLDRSLYYFFQVAPQLSSEAEWTTFQTHCFSENLEAPGIEPGTSESVASPDITRTVYPTFMSRKANGYTGRNVPFRDRRHLLY
jgi:hypothetical protein